MRRVTMALLLLAGCASGGASNHELSVDVVEVISRHQPPPTVGTRMFQIQIANKSQQNITIHLIQVRSGSGDFEIDDPGESVETTLAPGQAEAFQAFVTVRPTRMSQGTYRMDSLGLTISCSVETGDFLESGTYPITYAPSH